jgi:hypothetical protein
MTPNSLRDRSGGGAFRVRFDSPEVTTPLPMQRRYLPFLEHGAPPRDRDEAPLVVWS